MNKTTEEQLTEYRAPAHQKRHHGSRNFLRVFGLVFLALVLSGTSAFGMLVYRLQTNVQQHDLASLLDEKERPQEALPLDQKAGQPLNILILGSDTRNGKSDIDGSGKSGKVEGMRSDTTMLAHVSADRKRVDVVSIPRDTLVSIPSCTLETGKVTKAQAEGMFNSAFQIGGANGDVNSAAACTVKTVEAMTKVLVDGYVVLDFASFQDVVNTIGGVEMCFQTNVKDSYSGLNIAAGCHNLMGADALALARARHGLGDGSDVSRIDRQQELVGKIVTKILSMNLFTNLPKFYQLLTDVTKNVQTSTGLGDLKWLSGFLYSLKDIDRNNVKFITMPYALAGNRAKATPQAQTLWDALRTDTPVPPSAMAPQHPQKELVITPNAPAATPGTTGTGSTQQAPANGNTQTTTPTGKKSTSTTGK
ncbi:LCP family protein required for cell wall assembly [Arcanobacterium pluranimalium]|uniref:LCP family glycopolymer transferase n=1 Tax=Arcanobacterium pluranimalium TaxID=108028 RepID=UPI001957FE49|nr:LCP family protein required for cell wall assembly [Arcanobacterium pluranimalium]